MKKYIFWKGEWFILGNLRFTFRHICRTQLYLLLYFFLHSVLVLHLSVLTHFPLIQADLTPLIEEQIYHRTFTNSAMICTLRWVGCAVDTVQDLFFTKKTSESLSWFLTPKNDFGSKYFANFEEVVHNFGRSDNFLVKKCLFSIYADVVSCPTWSKNLGWYLRKMHLLLVYSTKFVAVAKAKTVQNMHPNLLHWYYKNYGATAMGSTLWMGAFSSNSWGRCCRRHRCRRRR
jgi:hypothetical protein